MAESVPEHDDPGRPIGADEIDHELVALALRPRARVGPLLAAAIVLFCGYFMVKLMADLRFSFRDNEPKTIGHVAEIINKDGAAADDFVRVNLTPDHTLAVRVGHSRADEGHRLTPVLGTKSKLWLLDAGSPWAAAPSYHTVYQGRLRYLSDMPFYDELRRHLSKAKPAPRYVPSEAVRTALQTKADSVIDGAGDPLSVTPATPVVIVEVDAQRALVRAYFGERLPDLATWRKALIDAGLPSAAAKPKALTREVITWELSDPEGLVGVTKKLAAAKLFSARPSELRRHYEATWAILSASPTGLVVSGKTSLPWANLSSISLTVARTVPSDAMVMIANESPAAYWYVKYVYVLLALFSVLFCWGFIRSIRRSGSPAKQAETASAAA